ncbi:large conductance mechanosensitive channel protein MscL [soil metagenome]
MFEEFKKFIFKGDVVSLATGVIIGASFGKIVTAFTDGVVTPLLSMVGGGGSVSLGFTVGSTRFDLGVIISSLISFVITAAVIFFFLVKPAQAMMARMKTQEAAAPLPPSEEVKLLTQIRDSLQK